MLYSLFNKANNRPLKIRNLGIWSTDSKEEAEAMLDACIQYVEAVGLTSLKHDIIIVDSFCLTTTSDGEQKMVNLIS